MVNTAYCMDAVVLASVMGMDIVGKAWVAWEGTASTGMHRLFVQVTLGDTCLGMWEACMVEIVAFVVVLLVVV